MRQSELNLQSFYGVCALAEVANVSRYVMNRLLRLAGVRFQRIGRSVLVPVSEIEEKIPLLWNSLQVLERVRRAASERSRRAGPRCAEDRCGGGWSGEGCGRDSGEIGRVLARFVAVAEHFVRDLEQFGCDSSHSGWADRDSRCAR